MTHTANRHGHRDQLLPAPAEDLCLAFANTRYWRGREQPTETLSGFEALLTWLEGNAGLPAATVQDMRRWSDRHAELAAEFLAEAVTLRETIHRLFTATAAGGAIRDPDLAALNDGLAASSPRVRLIRRDRRIGWAAAMAAPIVPALLAPVLWSAADLLAHAEERRVRRCANEECLWLFMDHSKGGTRRWCDMNACGNRAKAKRHYQRVRQG